MRDGVALTNVMSLWHFSMLTVALDALCYNL